MQSVIKLTIVAICLCSMKLTSAKKSFYSKNSYFVIYPFAFRPGGEAAVVVNILKSASRYKPVNITVQITDSRNQAIASSNSPAWRGYPTTFVLRIPPFQTMDQFKINVRGTGSLDFEDNSFILLNEKVTSLFVQTDRPIYRPGDTVHIRAFGTFPNLLPVPAPLDVIVINSRESRVQQWIQARPASGVFEGSFKLSERTTVGTWRIVVQQILNPRSRPVMREARFRVSNDGEPKFQVQIEMPAYSLTKDTYIKGNVVARYIFGKPVPGNVTVFLNHAHNWFNKRGLQKFYESNGKNVEFQFLMSDIFLRFGRHINLTAVVTEGTTGIQRSSTRLVRLYDAEEKLSFLPGPPAFKPMLPYRVAIRLSLPDDSPYPSPRGEIKFTVTYRKTSGISHDEHELLTRYLPIMPNGIAQDVILLPRDAVSASLLAEYKNASQSMNIIAARSPSKNFLQILSLNQRPTIGSKLDILFLSTEKIKSINYQVIAKGGIVLSGYEYIQGRSNPNSGSILTITATERMAPQSILLMYYIRKDGEVVMDNVFLQIDGVIKNKVSIQFSKTTAKPQDRIDLLMEADPNSLVSVVVSDRNTDLEGTGQILESTVINELSSYNAPANGGPTEWMSELPTMNAGIDASSFILGSGLRVLTDATIFLYDAITEASRANADVNTKDRKQTTTASPTTEARTYFPKTWIWKNVTTGPDGKATIKEFVPDTLTSWTATAFAMNPRTGLGCVNRPTEVTVSMPFFLKLILPSTAIYGEVLMLQVDAYNYVGKDIDTVITLEKSKDYSVAIEKVSQRIDTTVWRKNLFLKNGDADSVYFPIVPQKMGNVYIRVSGQSSEVYDSVHKTILVQPDGVQQRFNIPVLKDLKRGERFTTNVPIRYPPVAVPGSTFAQIYAVGDLLGPTVTGMERMFQMPFGCGEQILIGLGTIMYAAKYLQRTMRLSPPIRAQAIEQITSGYQMELVYRRDDGSFSAFGKDDKAGSTWLTAYVLKLFSQATDFISVDVNVTTEAVRFILSNQQNDGSFIDQGNVIRRAFIAGGSSHGDISLTSYCAVSLIEARSKNSYSRELADEVDQAIAKAINYIKKVVLQNPNTYEQAIMLYALTLVRDPMTDTLLQSLERQANVRGGMKYWLLPDELVAEIQPLVRFRPTPGRARALDIETTAYVLLSYAIREDTENGIQVMRWLATQRNEFGGYVSTQDTVIAVQGYAEMATQIFSPNFNVIATVTDTHNQRFTHTFQLNMQTALLTQSIDVPKYVQELNVTLSGQGIALVEVVLSFNIREDIRRPSFYLNATLKEETIQGFQLGACFRWLRQGETGMVLLEIEIPTGMDYIHHSVNVTLLPTFKRLEKKDNKLNVYIDKANGTLMCIDIKMRRVDIVAHAQASTIVILDYYEPRNTATTTYVSKLASTLSVDDICEGKCSSTQV